MAEKINIVLDATMLDTFQSCFAKYNYRFNMNRVTPTKAKPLDRGGLIHVGLENYYTGLMEHLPYEFSIDKATKAVRVAAMESDLETADTELVFDTLAGYYPRWKIQDYGFEINAVEKAFSYILYEDDSFRIVMIGKIDLLISDNKYTNMPVDHKSYDRDFPVKRLTNQFINYANAVGSNYLLVNRVGFQTSYSPEKKHKRIPLMYDHLIIEQWRQNTIKWAMVYYDCVERNDWSMNLTSCDKFNRLCEYYEICDTSGEESKVYKLNTNFKVDTPWDVSKVLAQKE